MKPVADNELNPSCQCSDITLKKKHPKYEYYNLSKVT